MEVRLLKRDRPRFSKRTLNAVMSVLIRKAEEYLRRRRGGHVEMEAENGVTGHKPRSG